MIQQPHIPKIPKPTSQHSNLHIFSEKDSQFLQQTCKRIIQNYYQESNQQNALLIMLFNDLLRQAIDSNRQITTIRYNNIISKLEVLKIKAKSCRELMRSIQSTVDHMKNPRPIPIEFSKIGESLKYRELYPFCCLIIDRLYRTKIKIIAQNQDINNLIMQIGEGSKYNINSAIETILMMMENGEHANYSGIVQFAKSILNEFLHAYSSIKKDKLQVGRLFKIIKMAAKMDTTLIQGLEDKVAEVIYTYECGIPQIQEILQLCLSQQYFRQILYGNQISEEKIDLYFVWSFCMNFCKQITQDHADNIEKILKVENEGQKLTKEIQYKIYLILTNFIRIKNLTIHLDSSLPFHTKQNLHPYLMLIETALQHNSLQIHQKFDISALEKICNQNENGDESLAKIIKNVRQLIKASQSSTISQIQNLNQRQIQHSQSQLAKEEKIYAKENEEQTTTLQVQDNFDGKINQNSNANQQLPNDMTQIKDFQKFSEVEKQSSINLPPTKPIIDPSSSVVENAQTTKQASSKQMKQSSNISARQTKQQEKLIQQTAAQKARKLIPNVFLRFKVRQLVKKWKKKMKRSKQRFYKLKEWTSTEDVYLKKLIVLRDQIKTPLVTDGLISQEKASKIFSNLDSMIELAKEMKKTIDDLLKHWSPIHTELAPFLKIIPSFLKIYKNYSLNYKESFTEMQEPKYKEYVKGIDLENYLFSPVQRFQKYHLFVKEYLGNLSPEHKDYAELKKALDILLGITDEINQFIGLGESNFKLIELEKRFKNIVGNVKQYKADFTATCFDFKCKIYALNDLLLVTRLMGGGKQQLYLRMPLCSNSFVIKQPDCKSFENRLYICGTYASIHLIFEDRQQLQSQYKLISELIEVLYKNEYKRRDLISQGISRVGQLNNNQSSNQRNVTWQETGKNLTSYCFKLRVQVIGVQKRTIEDFPSKIIFIIKIQLPRPEQIYQLLFCDLETLNSLEKYLKELYPDLKIPTLQIKNRGTTFLDLSKVSEHQCIAIQVFLNFILRNPIISKRPWLILHKLGLHESLWEYINGDLSMTQCCCESCLHAEIFTGIDFYSKQKNMIQSMKYKFCILNSFRTQNTIQSMVDKSMLKTFGIENKLVWANCFLKRIDHRLKNKKVYGKPIKFKVQVRFISEQVLMTVKQATIYSTCRDVIEQICKRINVQTTLDLALVLVQQSGEIILDDDQYIYDVYVKHIEDKEIKEDVNNVSNGGQRPSLFNLFGRANSLVEPSKKRKRVYLSLRKIIVFEESLEEKACQDNPQRCQIILGEFLRKFQENRFILNHIDIQILCANLYCIEQFSTLQVESKVNIKEEGLKKYLPNSKWDMIKPEFVQKVVQIIEKQLSQDNKISSIYLSTLKYFGIKFSWHCQYFPVQNTETSLLLGNFSHICIGISYRKVIIAKQNIADLLLQYPISSFKYHVYAQSLFMESEEKVHRLIGPNLFILDKLLKIYKYIHDFEYAQ